MLSKIGGGLQKAGEALSKATRSAVSRIEGFFSPPRTKYDENKLPKILSTNEDDNIVGNYIRIPVRIINDRKQMIHGSVYKLDTDIDKDITQCLIYLHGVSSSQLEGQFLVPNLCSHHIAVCCFDFIGCGNSDGKWISLGYYEHLDTECVIKTLEETFGFKEFALWGRSMGAATAILTSHPGIKSIVVDSAFKSAEELFNDLAAQNHIPKSMFYGSVKLFAQMSFGSDFKIENINCIKAVSEKAVPAAYGHATDDKFIPFEHGKSLYEAHSNKDKDLMELTGGHNGYRSADWIRYGVSFVLNHFGIFASQATLEVSECRKLQAGNEQFDSFESLLANKKNSPQEETEEKPKHKHHHHEEAKKDNEEVKKEDDEEQQPEKKKKTKKAVKSRKTDKSANKETEIKPKEETAQPKDEKKSAETEQKPKEENVQKEKAEGETKPKKKKVVVHKKKESAPKQEENKDKPADEQKEPKSAGTEEKKTKRTRTTKKSSKSSNEGKKE